MLKGGNGHDLIEIDEVDKRSDNFVNNYHSSSPKNVASEVQMDILENGQNSDSALEKACNKSDANKVTQYKKTMEQQITELNLQLVEMSTKLEYTTGKMNETENELRDTKIELYNTMKQLVDTRDECSFYEEMRMHNLRSHNELSEYNKLNLRLQGELCRANTDVDNLKQEISKRQNNVEQPKINFQVNSSTHGTYINEGN